MWELKALAGLNEYVDEMMSMISTETNISKLSLLVEYRGTVSVYIKQYKHANNYGAPTVPESVKMCENSLETVFDRYIIW